MPPQVGIVSHRFEPVSHASGAPTELHVALSREALQLVEERHDPSGVGALEDDHGVALTLAHAGALDE